MAQPATTPNPSASASFDSHEGQSPETSESPSSAVTSNHASRSSSTTSSTTARTAASVVSTSSSSVSATSTTPVSASASSRHSKEEEEEHQPHGSSSRISTTASSRQQRTHSSITSTAASTSSTSGARANQRTTAVGEETHHRDSDSTARPRQQSQPTASRPPQPTMDDDVQQPLPKVFVSPLPPPQRSMTSATIAAARSRLRVKQLLHDRVIAVPPPKVLFMRSRDAGSSSAPATPRTRQKSAAAKRRVSPAPSSLLKVSPSTAKNGSSKRVVEVRPPAPPPAAHLVRTPRAQVQLQKRTTKDPSVGYRVDEHREQRWDPTTQTATASSGVLGYNALRDPALGEYFASPRTRETLSRTGVVTADGRIVQLDRGFRRVALAERHLEMAERDEVLQKRELGLLQTKLRGELRRAQAAQRRQERVSTLREAERVRLAALHRRHEELMRRSGVQIVRPTSHEPASGPPPPPSPLQRVPATEGEPNDTATPDSSSSTASSPSSAADHTRSSSSVKSKSSTACHSSSASSLASAATAPLNDDDNQEHSHNSDDGGSDYEDDEDFVSDAEGADEPER